MPAPTTPKSSTKQELTLEAIHNPSYQFHEWLASKQAHNWIEQELLGQTGKLSVIAEENECVDVEEQMAAMHISGEKESVKEGVDQVLDGVRAIYAELDAGQDVALLRSQFDQVMQACQLPIFLASSFWRYLTEEWSLSPGDKQWRNTQLKRLTYDRFERKWEALSQLKDRQTLVYTILKCSHPQLSSLSGEAFEPLVEDVVNYHDELGFLKGNLVFSRRYVETVIMRIFYSITRAPPPVDADVLSGRVRGMTLLQFKTSGFCDILDKLAQMEINHERQFFSYKHFFVMYCKFFDLDTAKAFRLGISQLLRYDGGALNRIACQRICEGVGLSHKWRAQSKGKYLLNAYHYGVNSIRVPQNPDSGVDLAAGDDEEKQTTLGLDRIPGSLNFADFMFFLLSEEDRTSVTALEYWFRVVDLDNDGLISLYELEQYWTEQEDHLRLENCGFDFRDIVCIAIDLLKPEGATTSSVSLKQLKKKPVLAARFFDFFLNWKKLMERESTNGSRLFREIDEAQQSYFHQLHAQSSTKDVSGDDFLPEKIPKDRKTCWSRWADLEYEHYIIQEELEQQRTKLKQAQLSPSLVRVKKSRTSLKRAVLIEDVEDEDFEDLLDEEDADFDSEDTEEDDSEDEDDEDRLSWVRRKRLLGKRKSLSISVSASLREKTKHRRMAVISAHNIDTSVSFWEEADEVEYEHKNSTLFGTRLEETVEEEEEPGEDGHVFISSPTSLCRSPVLQPLGTVAAEHKSVRSALILSANSPPTSPILPKADFVDDELNVD